MRAKPVEVVVVSAIAVFLYVCSPAIAAPPTFTISGVVASGDGMGIEGVDVIGDNGAGSAVTGANGSYSINVSNRWSGTVTVSKEGWLITPSSRTYEKVSENLTNEDYAAYQPKISGYVREADGTALGGTDVSTNDEISTASSVDGYYEVFVPYNWSGSVSASTAGYYFADKSYSNVVSDQANQDFTGYQPTISGYVRKADGTGLTGAMVSGGSVGSTTTNGSGHYQIIVPYSWSGIVSASLAGFRFAAKDYTNVTTDQTNQDFSGYQPTISGIITSCGGPVEGVTLTANSGGGKAGTDSSGDYSLVVPYGWSGIVTPAKPQYIFTPVNTAYSNVTGDIVSQDYNSVLAWGSSGERCPWIERQKLTPGGISIGRSVSISGDYAVIGRDAYVNVKGAAHMFKRNRTGWVEQQRLSPSDSADGDYFGRSVAISGDYVVVGACGNNNCKGAAYIFTRDGTSWLQQQKLTALDGVADDDFGLSVSISGDYALIGMPGDDNWRGSAYIFKRDGTGWTQRQKLVGSGTSAGDEFGRHVRVNGNYLIISSREHWGWTGSAYIFEFDGTHWIEQKKLLASDGAYLDGFGESLAISDEYAIVGSPSDDDRGSRSGSAYVFKREGITWVQQQKILASDGSTGAHFASSISMEGDYAVIGADCDYYFKGSAYVFRRDGTEWLEQQKLGISSSSYQDQFGTSVSISRDYVIIGAPGDDERGTDSGCAYVFSPALVLQRPDGGENLVAGSSCDTSWDATSTIENIFIAYSIDGGDSWSAIDTVPNTGSYLWTVPDVNANQCLVGVCDAGNATYNDVSSNTFRIYKCTLTCDTNRDCFVDLQDFAGIASEWSESGATDFLGLIDFTVEWLRCGDPADPNCQ